MELAFPHKVEYEQGTASIEETIENLRAQKKLIEEAVKFLDFALKNIEVESVKIQVVRVYSGSLLTEFLVLVYGAYQRDVQETVIGGIESMFGTDIPVEYEALVTLATLAVTYFVARYAYDAVRSKKKDRPEGTHITGDYNTVINIVAEKLELPVTDVEDALHDAIPRAKRRSLIKSVTKFLRPREDGRISPVKVEGFGELNPQGLAEYPSDSDLAEIDDSRNLDLPAIKLDIRATDKDRNNTGWAAVIVGDKRFRKRLPMDLYPTVDAARLAKNDTVVGDIIVEGERRADGSFRAKRIHLLAVKEDDNGKPPIER